MSSRVQKPDERTLARARDEFRALLERRTIEPKWQRFFSANPYVFSMSLPVRLDPTDLHRLAVQVARPSAVLDVSPKRDQTLRDTQYAPIRNPVNTPTV